jgi:5-methylcytosine-specific restriction endonuclease McrA
MNDELKAITDRIQQINHTFHQTAKQAYVFAREHHADPKYEAFRDSEAGRIWRAQKLAECHYRCPECNKIINNLNSSIDHKHSRRNYPWLSWNVNNLWVLCKDCNYNKADCEWEDYLKNVERDRDSSALKRVLKYAPPATPKDDH